jgi:NAD(P)-dependent dehydrogenase (short-subunit alcohol dehydrogenase family)
MQDVQGRVAVVTGAASGMGLAIAQRFASAGMKVVLSDVEAPPLETAVKGIRDAGHDAVGVVTDVSDESAVQQLAKTAFDTHGAVHLLVNNAGVVKRARTWEHTNDDLEWQLQVNLWGVVYGLRHFLPRMLEQAEGGHIVNTASMAALLPHPNLGGYAASKSAVLGLTLSLQTELEQMGNTSIGVSALCPGYIATGITNAARNRPARYDDESPPPDVARTTSGVTARLRADDVAEQVLHAVQTNRFWILTHPEYRAVINEFANGIGTDARPQPAPIW